jgi:putative RecB family exonuclease
VQPVCGIDADRLAYSRRVRGGTCLSELYSHSRLRSFENCRKQFHFRYVMKLPQETEGVEAFVGKRVHEVLERLYVFVGEGKIPSLPQVQHRYELLWEAEYDPDRVRIVREGTPLSFYRELGSRCLDIYYRRHYPFDEDETLGIEERVKFDLVPDVPGSYRMQGIIDRISRTPSGTLEIHDYKTGKYVPNQKALDSDRQLALYQLGLADRYGSEGPVELVWHYVARGTIRRSTRTPEQLEELRADTMGVIDQIRAEESYEPKKNNLCDWCEYRSVCPAWNAQTAEPLPATPSPQPRRPSPQSRRPLELPAVGPEQLDLL